MEKNIKRIICSFIVFVFILATSTFAEDIELKAIEPEYSEAYEEYMQLSDEEKAELIEPRKYAIKNTYNSTNDALIANGTVSLKNYINYLRSTATISDDYFSLKNVISSNLSIRDQQETGICWTFATLSSLETNLALQDYYNNNNTEGSTVYDYSEMHMAYSKTQMYDDKTNEYGVDWSASSGGNTWMATSYLTNGQGAVSEEKLPFVNDDTTKVDSSTVEDLDAETTVTSYIWFDSLDITSASDSEIEDMKTAIKEHIVNYGSVEAAICSSLTYINFKTGAIYNNYSISNADHAVSIVGWDDSYSKENFNTSPKEDGAWIIRNSWGEKLEYTYTDLNNLYLTAGYTQTQIDENWDSIIAYYVENGFTNDETNKLVYMYLGVSESDGGEGYGYFYVSYEDYTIYTNCEGVVSADDEVTYSNIYQHDEVGMTYAYYYEASKTYDTYLANVFTRTTTDTEYLSSVGLTSYASGTYEVYVNPNGTSKASSDLEQVTFADGTTKITLTAGYNTIDFKESIELTGTNFVIVMKALTDGENYTWFSTETNYDNYASTVTSNSGESYATFSATGYFDSNNWVDIGDTSSSYYCGNLCIKGITTTSSVTSSTNTDNNSGLASTDEVIATNSDFSSATATATNISISSITGGDSTLDMTIEIEGIVVEDEDQTFEQYFYLSTDSDADTSSVSNSNWAKVDAFEKQSDGTYTITLTVTEDSYFGGIDTSADNLYVYIKEIATKDSSTSTLITDGIIITANINGDEDDEDDEDDSDDEEEPEDNTTATSSLPYTGIKTILIIITIAGACVIFTCAKYKSMNDIK